MYRRYYQINNASCLPGCLGVLLFSVLLYFIARTLFWIFGPLLVGLFLLWMIRQFFGKGSSRHEDIEPLYDDRDFEEIDSDERDK